jgi:hypothetical protein
MRIKHWISIFGLLSQVACSVGLPQPHSIDYNDKDFQSTTDLIFAYPEIFEMDDLTRYSKSINGVSIQLPNDGDSPDSRTLKHLADSFRFDFSKFSEIREKLEKTKLREFVRSGDSILFICDGFLDDSWGFMYSKRKLQMDSSWFTFRGHSVKFVEQVNNNWKRVAVR